MSVGNPRKEFARQLDDARREAHLSIRDVGRLAEVPTPTAQGWLSGKHFPVPALRGNYLKMVEALGLGDQVPSELWNESWQSLQPRLKAEHPPYLGLRPFTAADSDLFFGRTAEVRRLAEAVKAIQAANGHGLLAVVGPSGCGKSSLLAAGLIGIESADGLLAGWSVRQLAPTQLAEPVATAPDLVVIDQFEEVFQLPEPEQALLLESLGKLVSQSVVVVALRADAFGVALGTAELAGALQRPFLVAPLTRDQARDAVRGPATLAGLEVAEELVGMLIDDLGSGPVRDSVTPDVLPLLSTAMLATWAASQGNRLDVADYVRSGGVACAVQGLAEEVFDSLDQPKREAVHQLFLQLVRPIGEEVLRAPVPLAEVPANAREGMDAFVSARMLTLTDETVRISHAALLSHWGRLATWIEESRADLVVLEQVRRAAQLWHDADRSADALIPVERLELFSEWVADPERARLLGQREREFLDASREHFGSVLAHEQRVNTRLRSGRRMAVGLSALATALALVTGALYWNGLGLQAQADNARLDAQSRQVALEARSVRAEDSNLMAQMSLVAASLADTRQANSALLDATSVNTPVRWLGASSAVLAKSADDQLVARADGAGKVTLWRGEQLLTQPGASFVADPSGGPLYAAAMATNSGRSLLAVGGGSAAGLWDVTEEPRQLSDLRDGEFTVYGLAFTAAGDQLAMATSAGSVELWSVSAAGATRGATLQLGAANPAKAVSFDPAGSVLYVAGLKDGVARWQMDGKPKRLGDLGFAYNDAHVISQSLQVSPDGKQLAVGIAGRRVLRWSLDGLVAKALPPLLSVESWTNDLAYSKDGSVLLVANSDQFTHLFDAASGAELQKLGGDTLVTGVEMVGGRPVSVGADGVLRVWQATNPVLRSGSPVYALSTDPGGQFLAASSLSDGFSLFSTAANKITRLPDPAVNGRSMAAAVGVAPNGGFLLGGTTDGSVLTWPLSQAGAGVPQAVDVFPGSYIGALAVSPNSGLVAVLQYTGTKVALYSADPGGKLSYLSTLATPTPQGVTFSPDGQLLAVPIENRAVQLWNVADPANPVIAGQIDGLPSMPTIAAFANTSRKLAVGTDSGRVSVWEVSDPAQPKLAESFGDPHAAVYSAAFSPDDARLVVGGGDQMVWAWRLGQGATEAYLALDGKLGHTNDVRFIHGGSRLVVAGGDGLIRTWASDLDQARRDLCSNRGAALTEDEWARYLPGITAKDPC